MLGDAYIELIPGREGAPTLKRGEYIQNAGRLADYQNLFQSVGQITEDLKVITSALKDYTVTDQSMVAKILQNMEALTGNLATVSSRNMQNMDAIITNLAALTADLRGLSHEGGEDLEVALARISEITEKINSGQGTIGRLINDDGTIEKTDQVLNNLQDITSTYFSMKTTVGYHLEYLARSGSAKSYITFKLRPRPDKFFKFDVVFDPNPPGSTSNETEIIETGGTTTTVFREKTTFDKVRFSAQLGKTFRDFTLRGGLIESTGGFGVDYHRGPVAVKFEAFDFGGGNPHLKAMTELNITRSIYILGGVDDITGKRSTDWFFGAGLRFTDEDVNSLFGGAALILSR